MAKFQIKIDTKKIEKELNKKVKVNIMKYLKIYLKYIYKLKHMI